jgi:hypothetical protein
MGQMHWVGCIGLIGCGCEGYFGLE